MVRRPLSPRFPVARTAILARPAVWWLLLAGVLAILHALLAVARPVARVEYLEPNYARHATSRIVAPGEIIPGVPAVERVPVAPVPLPSDPALIDVADDVRATMAGLSLPLRHPVAVRYAGREEMVVRVSSGNLVTTEQNAIGKFRRTGDVFEVFVIAGTSPRDAARIVAHELGHVYYEENFRVFKSRLHREGFAEWVAYRVLGEVGARAERLAMRTRDDLYGQGLRMMLREEKDGGTAAVIRLAME